MDEVLPEARASPSILRQTGRVDKGPGASLEGTIPLADSDPLVLPDDRPCAESD
ncbi:MAG: hypothetical protein AAGC67_13605 [Myxococcota bacterium]